MPNIKSSKKSVRTDRIKQTSNTSYLSRVKNGMKKLDKAIKANDKDNAKINAYVVDREWKRISRQYEIYSGVLLRKTQSGEHEEKTEK